MPLHESSWSSPLPSPPRPSPPFLSPPLPLELTIGVFNCEEYTIAEPLPPSELKGIIYNTCFKHDLFECVLQQEVGVG